MWSKKVTLFWEMECNIAARVQSLAEAGGICITGTAYDQIKNKLALGYEYVGEQTVKNIKEPVKIYRVLMEPGIKVPEAILSPVTEEKKTRRKKLSIAILAGVALVVIAGAAVLYLFAIRPSAPKMEVASKEKMAFPLPDKTLHRCIALCQPERRPQTGVL